MDKLRGTKTTFKSQTSIAPKAIHEDFKPAVEWTEDQSNRMLLIHLPGFKREEIRVQLDNAGKLLIKGIKQVRDKHVSVDLSFDVPDDTISEKISGKFEDERLTLVMPKKVVKGQEVTEKGKAISEDKGKEPIQNEKPNNAEAKKEEEGTQKRQRPTKIEKGEEKKYEPTREQKSTAIGVMQNQPTQKEKPKSNEDSKHETIQNLISQAGEAKEDDGPIGEEKFEKGEEKKDEPVEKSESVEEKKKKDPLQAMIKAVERGKEEKTIQKMKSKVREMCTDKPKEIMKRVSTWKDAENSYGWMGLEKMNRNRKVIGIAVVAFSVGFYVSHKQEQVEDKMNMWCSIKYKYTVVSHCKALYHTEYKLLQ